MNKYKENRVKEIAAAELHLRQQLAEAADERVRKETRKIYIVAACMIVGSIISLFLLGE